MRITVKRLESRDLYQLQAIVKQDIAEKANIPYPFTKEVALSFINDYNTWGIWMNGSILAGAIEVKDTYETAYFVSHNLQNIGIATEAVKQIKEIFAGKQLWCVINPNNKASLRVAQKAVMRVQFFQDK